MHRMLLFSGKGTRQLFNIEPRERSDLAMEPTTGPSKAYNISPLHRTARPAFL
jgi:hypothetical protein